MTASKLDQRTLRWRRDRLNSLRFTLFPAAAVSFLSSSHPDVARHYPEKGASRVELSEGAGTGLGGEGKIQGGLLRSTLRAR